MKRIILSILVLMAIQTAGIAKLDSLYSIIENPRFSDTLKLETYEIITKQLLKSDKDSCRAVCKMGLRFSEQLGNKRFIWSFHNRIGISYYYESDYESAVKHWIEALKVAEEAKDIFTISQSLNNIAIVYGNTDRYEKAIEYYKKALEIKYQDKETSQMSILMAEINIAILYGKLGDLNTTDSLLRIVLKKMDKINEHDDKYKILVNIGSTYAFLGSHQDKIRLLYKGLKYFFLAETEINQTDNKRDKITLLLNIGETYLQLNDEENGFKHVWQAKKIADEIDSDERKAIVFEVLVNHYEHIKNYELAYIYYDSMQQLNEKINDLRIQTAIEDMQTKYETEKKERENLELKQLVRNEELENQRQKRIKNAFLIFFIIAVIIGIVLIYLFSKLRTKNTELTKNKKVLENLNDDLKLSKEETEKALEFKSLFLANMSHEIRTPLNIIIGFNSILKKSIADSKLMKYLESIETSSYNLLRFLNDILDMSKIEAGKIMLTPENINLKVLITNIKDLFQLKADEKDIELKVEIDKNVPHEIIIDEIRLRQILLNLIGNAIKFTEAGYVKIKIESPTLNNYRSKFSTITNLKISIEDTGIGISESDLEQIFESFRQVNLKEQKQFGGTGLGLAISKRLTTMMDGEITVSSEKGKGSTFSVLFKDVPIGMPTEPKTKRTTNFTDDLDFEFNGGTILVADDEDMNRSLIKVCFENTNVEVIEASNGEEAIELARKNNPDIILMDVKMPIIDGIEATKIIKNDDSIKHIQIIAFSASNIFERIDDDEIEMFAGLITKPVDIDELYEKAALILPHSKKSIDSPQLEAHGKLLPEHFFDDLSCLNKGAKDKLLNEFKQKWSDVYSTNSMNKILAFTGELVLFATENSMPGLKVYAEKIMESGNSFDTIEVKSLLKLFPEIIHTK